MRLLKNLPLYFRCSLENGGIQIKFFASMSKWVRASPTPFRSSQRS